MEDHGKAQMAWPTNPDFANRLLRKRLAKMPERPAPKMRSPRS
jgi:hypothetical protein